MIIPSYTSTATERVLPKLALDFTTSTLDPRVTFTRATGASNPATYINSSGAITTATNNQPRFDYDPVTLVCKGLLIEESRTNSLLNTDLLSTQIVTVTAAVRTLSFYGTGSVTLSGAHSAVVSGTGAYPTRTTYSFTPTAGALTLTVAGTVQYAQLEAGAFATSYIPTTIAALTRNADVATMTGTNFSDWFNATEGTASIWFDSFESGNGNLLTFSDSTANNFIANFKQAANTYGLYTVSGGVLQAAISFGSGITLNSQNKLVTAYKAGSNSSSINGNTAVTGNSGTLPTVNRLNIGANQSLSATDFLNGHVQKIMYWPSKLTDRQIQAFSK